MHRSKSSFLEWLVYSLIFFFLYDIIWILVDLPDFLQSVSGLYTELLVDFALCGLFSLSSLYLNRWLFKQRRFRREGQGHRVFVQNGLVVLGFNLLIAGGCELLLSLVAPKLMMQDIWGNVFPIWTDSESCSTHPPFDALLRHDCSERQGEPRLTEAIPYAAVGPTFRVQQF